MQMGVMYVVGQGRRETQHSRFEFTHFVAAAVLLSATVPLHNMHECRRST